MHTFLSVAYLCSRNKLIKGEIRMKLNKDFLRCNDLGLLVLRLTMAG